MTASEATKKTCLQRCITFCEKQTRSCHHHREGSGKSNMQIERDILHDVHNKTSISSRMVTYETSLSPTAIWRTLHEEQLHPSHLQLVQGPQLRYNNLHLQFCRWPLHKTVHESTSCVMYTFTMSWVKISITYMDRPWRSEHLASTSPDLNPLYFFFMDLRQTICLCYRSRRSW